MIYKAISYLKFLAASKNKHGVHSPFVFDLVTNCLYDKRPYSDYEKLGSYRKHLLSDHTIVEIEDLGAGSKSRKSNTTTFQNVAKTAGSPLSQTKLLYRLSRYFQPTTILELGTSLGLATQAFALGSPHSQIYTLEGSKVLSNYAADRFEELELKQIVALQGSFDDNLKVPPVSKWDMAFLDGNHVYDATLNYFNELLPSLHNDSVVILDDIYWSSDMEKAWKSIKNHPSVTVTIDLFYKGLVFFRSEQAKEHFKIRL